MTPMDLKEFIDIVCTNIRKIFDLMPVNSAVIYNNTDKPVTFFVYNFIDSVYWISAQRTHIAPGTYGSVAASGAFFKIHPNDNRDHEFLVAPHNAYVYSGPGRVFNAADLKDQAVRKASPAEETL